MPHRRTQPSQAAGSGGEGFFRSLFEENAVAMMLIAPDTGDILDANRAACAFYGWERDALRRKTIFELHTLDPEQVRAKLQAVRDSGRGRFELQDRLANGEVRDVEINSGPIAVEGREIFCSSILDVTERKRIARSRELLLRELAESEEKFSKAFVSSPGFMFLSETETGRIIEANEAYLRLTGLTREEMIGRTSIELGIIDPESRERILHDSMAGRKLRDCETTIRRKSGELRRVVYSLEPLDVSSRTCFLGMGYDITDRVQVEDDLRQAKELAEVSNRAKSEFLAKMSHELRTPMNSIMGMLRLLMTSDLSAKQRERVQLASDSAGSLLRLLNDLLDLSTIEAGRFELVEKEFRPRRLLAKVFKEIELPARERGLATSHWVSQKVPESLIGDPLRLEQILLNVLSNAVKFTDGGGISLELEPLDRSSGRPGGGPAAIELLFTIWDSGSGTRPERLERAFETSAPGRPFSLVSDDGTGLDLSICRELSQQMGGDVRAESQPGLGNTFYLRIPFQSGPAGQEPVQKLHPETERWDDLPQLHILLVEDQRMNQLFIVDLLSSKGHRIEVAGDGQQAMDRLSRKSFDLVLMDIKMPVMDGLEASRRIRTADPIDINPDIPIIGLSAHVPTELELSRFKDAGFNDYLIKPVSFEELSASLKHVLDNS